MSFQSFFFHNLTYKSMSEFLQSSRNKEDASAKPWIYLSSQTRVSWKFFPRYWGNSPPAQQPVSNRGNGWYCLWQYSYSPAPEESLFPEDKHTLSVSIRGSLCSAGYPYWHLQTATEPGLLLQSASPKHLPPQAGFSCPPLTPLCHSGAVETRAACCSQGVRMSRL